ncbi:hypothetical protein C7Y66_19205 [Chroococcidiopsis sp. CCALA 051]|uniref:pilus assembly FimT family protein n=1 Tax=Chroococcidiopsis sp. CCALA 051 TaxID=869949 RepID=UPI000D0DA34E|nr:prepilin-type N-terminal cleavage/methylation domain-containing protein [Chroococcidiopsis sp. CCALA 051]MBE9014645.1 prepilin-type N-terminal cleavage/methylation domain-containing protein [Chroococcidiopsidales cyanobacterium LEGE 13417]PSM47553.1 hypothetical protein C7Y66_19205 [Chroococcidiopsis sp. CCALA 051]
MRRLSVRRNNRNKGFSLIEILIIVVIIGILAAIALPSFAGSLDRVKLNQAVVEVRGLLQEAQRQAIRKSQPCDVMLMLSTTPVQITANCGVTGDRNLSKGVQLITNISQVTGNPIKITFGILGTAEFTVLSSRNPPPPVDSSGKLIFSVARSSIHDKKCLAISNTLGLTRTGEYAGDSTTANQITDDGMCTAS